MVHIGKEIKARFDALGISKAALADTLGIHRNSVPRLFESATCDVDVVRKASRLFNINLFEMLSKDVAGEVTDAKASEPAAAYGKKPGQIRLVIEVQRDDASELMIKEIVRSVSQ